MQSAPGRGGWTRPGGAYPPYLPPPYEPFRPISERVRNWLSVPWSMGEAFVALVIAFGIYFLVSLPASSVKGLPALPYLLYLGVFAPSIFGVAAWVTARHRVGWKSLGLTRDRLGTALAVGLGAGIAAFLVNVGLSSIVTQIARSLGYEVENAARVTGLGEASAWEIGLIVLAVVVVAPIVEEILFRGIFYAGLRQRLGVGGAVAVSALFFGFLHFQLLGFIPLAAIGAILALLYESQGSLAAPMVAHAMNNGIIVLITLLLHR